MFDERRSKGDVSRWRWVLGVGVVAALAVALVLLSLQGDDSSGVTTTSGSVTTTSEEVTSTTEPPLTTTTSVEQRTAEVEQLLQDLWFGWFDAIYRKDPDALWKVVATTRNHDAGVAAMESMEFVAEPNRTDIVIPSVEILLDRQDCLVVFQHLDFSAFRGDGATGETVSVLWPDQRYGFRFATDWQYANDLWQMDCDNLEREETP